MANLKKKLIEISDGLKYEPKISIKTFQQLYLEGEKQREIRQLFGKYIGESHIVHFPSPQGSGKTFFLLQLCLAISSEASSFLGEKIEVHGNTFYINLELGESIVSRRVRKLMANSQFELKENFSTKVMSGRQDLLTQLTNLIKGFIFYKPVLIVIDNLRLAFPDADMNSGGAITKLMYSLMAFRDEFNCAIVIVDHFKKHTSHQLTTSDLQSGSGVKSHLSDADMFLRKSCLDKNYRLLKRIKSRNFEESEKTKLIQFSPETFWFSLIDEDVNEADHIGLKDLSDKDEKKDRATELYQEGKTMEDIAQILGKAKSTISRWINPKT